MNNNSVTQQEPPKKFWKPHPGPQAEFMQRVEDVALFGGSKGPGKTDALLYESLYQKDKKNYRALILRRTYPQLQEILDRAHGAFPLLGGKWDGGKSRYRFPSGALITFGHCQNEEDKRRYQGHEYQYIGFDQLDEFAESQFNFICMQNRTSDPTLKCYIRATANPGGVGHWWVKRRFIDNKKPGNTYVIEFKIPHGRVLTRTSVFIPATIYDNPTLIEANPTYLANLMSLPEEDQKAYLQGDWNVFSSQTIFDAEGMRKQEGCVEDPEYVGSLKDMGDKIDLVLHEDGNLKVWRRWEPRRKYFVAVDVSKGGEKGDYSSVKIMDRHTWNVVGKWHGKLDPVQLGDIVYTIGEYYNWAEIAVEVWPGPGIATGRRLDQLEYPNLYRHMEFDGKGNHKLKAETGWQTNERTRYEMISTLQDVVRRGTVIIRDRDTLDEMYNFIRHPDGKPRGRSGCFDDQVMDLAIAVHCMKFNPIQELYGETDNEDKAMVVSSITKPNTFANRFGPRWRNRNKIA